MSGHWRRGHSLQGAHWLGCQWCLAGVQQAARVPGSVLVIKLTRQIPGPMFKAPSILPAPNIRERPEVKNDANLNRS